MSAAIELAFSNPARSTQVVGIVLADGTILGADGAIPVQPATLTPLGYEQITGLSSAKTLTVPEGATIADITVEGNAVRYRDDGVSPTSSVGMPLIQTQSLRYTGDLGAIKFIEQAVGALLNVSYSR